MFGKLMLFVLGVMTVVGGASVRKAQPVIVKAPILPRYVIVERTSNYVGRFQIPSVGVDVACYSSMAQSVVDARDSAAYFHACGHRIIADHVHQGFEAE